MTPKVLIAHRRIENQSLKAFNIHFALKNIWQKKAKKRKKCPRLFVPAFFLEMCARQRKKNTLTFFLRPPAPWAMRRHCQWFLHNRFNFHFFFVPSLTNHCIKLSCSYCYFYPAKNAFAQCDLTVFPIGSHSRHVRHTHTLHIHKHINQRLICPNEIVVRNFLEHYPTFKRKWQRGKSAREREETNRFLRRARSTVPIYSIWFFFFFFFLRLHRRSNVQLHAFLAATTLNWYDWWIGKWQREWWTMKMRIMLMRKYYFAIQSHRNVCRALIQHQEALSQDPIHRWDPWRCVQFSAKGETKSINSGLFQSSPRLEQIMWCERWRPND